MLRPEKILSAPAVAAAVFFTEIKVNSVFDLMDEKFIFESLLNGKLNYDESYSVTVKYRSNWL